VGCLPLTTNGILGFNFSGLNFVFMCECGGFVIKMNNVKLEPVLVSNLAYFDYSHQFVTGGIEEPVFLMYQLQNILKNFHR
jgi:hypothetical protein